MSKPFTTSNFKHTFKTDNATAHPSTESTNIIVLKIGSSSITSPDGHILVANLGRFVELTFDLRKLGYKVVIVSSGAVSVGVNKLKLTERPTSVVMKQAVAACGQSALISIYDNLFNALGITTAQLLLTRDNINSDYHYLNATNTLEQLLAMDIVPIINENDTVSISELKIGDNDSLSAMVSCMLNARHLFLATDVSSLYTADPKIDPTAHPLHLIENINDIVERFSTPAQTSITTAASPSTPTPDSDPLPRSSSATALVATTPQQTTGPIQSGRWGTGGIATKVTAANLCAACGVDTSIVSSMEFQNVFKILDGDYTVGTTFKGLQPFLSGRKKFLWVGMSPKGEIFIDHKCAQLFTSDLSRSYHLLPAGILYCTGNVTAGTCVNIVVADDLYLKQRFGKYVYFPSDHRKDPSTTPIQSAAIPQDEGNLPPLLANSLQLQSPVAAPTLENGTIIARGVSNFSSDDILKIRGANSKQMDELLGYGPRFHSVIESDNLAVHYRPAGVGNGLPK